MDNKAKVTKTAMKLENDMKALVLKLYDINAFKFGDFKMKVGVNSPVYFDLRVIVSYPEVMQSVAGLLSGYIRRNRLTAKHICGVPYTALPLSTLVSVQRGIPMLVRRKEAKAYGTKKLIEGVYKPSDTCIIIEDVITSGSSVLDTVADLKREGIVVTDAIVMVDREQGGAKNISKHSIRVHSLFTLSYMLKTLKEAGKVPNDTIEAVAKYIANVQIDAKGNIIGNYEVKPVINELTRWTMSFEKRAEMAKCKLSQEIFKLMATKKTNLCLAVDIPSCLEVLDLADKCGPYICLLKIHIDTIIDFHTMFPRNLRSMAKKHNFLVMEDRKFADIGHIVSFQCHEGPFQISKWADCVTAHVISGRSVLQGLGTCPQPDVERTNNEPVERKLRGVFIVAEMSTDGNLIDEHYREMAAKIATTDTHIGFVAGVVCQSKECFAFPGLVQLTPGVKVVVPSNPEETDELGQRYCSPEHVVIEKGADVCVVGRSIVSSSKPAEVAAYYRNHLWRAYQKRITTSAS